jgi:hypothetical protein
MLHDGISDCAGDKALSELTGISPQSADFMGEVESFGCYEKRAPAWQV